MEILAVTKFLLEKPTGFLLPLHSNYRTHTDRYDVVNRIAPTGSSVSLGLSPCCAFSTVGMGTLPAAVTSNRE